MYMSTLNKNQITEEMIFYFFFIKKGNFGQQKGYWRVDFYTSKLI